MPPTRKNRPKARIISSWQISHRLMGSLIVVFIAVGIAIVWRSLAADDSVPALKGDGATPTAEQNQVADLNVLWIGTFDNADWKANWGFTSGTPSSEHLRLFSFGNPDTSQTTLRGKTGKIDLPAGIGTRWLANSWFDRMGIAGQDEVYLKYDVFLPNNHQCTKGGKLPGLGAYSTPIGKNETPDSNNFSAGSQYYENSATGRILFTEEQTTTIGGVTRRGCTLKAYLYAKHVAGRAYDENLAQAGRSLVWNEANDYRNSDSPRYVLEFGKWNTVVLRYKMNTPGQNNGLFEGYINGTRGVVVDDIQYRSANYPSMTFNMMHMHVFYGGASDEYAPTATQKFNFDDFVISKAFVQPRELGGPAKPDGLRIGQASNHSFSVAWNADASSRAVAYDLYRNFQKIASFPASTTYKETVYGSANFRYYLVARDGEGRYSNRSAILDYQYSDKFATSAPKNLKVQSQSLLDISLAWDAPAEPDLHEYKIYRDGVMIATTQNPSYKDEVGNPLAKEYYVTAVDKDGNESVKSNVISRGPTLKR